MSESDTIHLAVDLSHYHTDYLWKMPGSWEGYPYYSSPEFYEDIARMASRGIIDMLFFGELRRYARGLRRQSSHRRPLRRQMAAARHDADDPMHVACCRGRRVRHHHVDHLSPSVPYRADLQLARSCHQGPDRLERRDLALQERGGELGLQEDDRARRALRARAGASPRLLRALGLRSSPTPSCSTARNASSGFPRRCTFSISRGNTTACAGRCLHCGRRRAVRSSSRPGSPDRAWTLPLTTPICSSARGARRQA